MITGLKLVLNIEVLQYLFDEAYGVRLVIHEPGTLPYPSVEGITLDTSFETVIGLRKVSIIYKEGTTHFFVNQKKIEKSKYDIQRRNYPCLCQQNKKNMDGLC